MICLIVIIQKCLLDMAKITDGDQNKKVQHREVGGAQLHFCIRKFDAYCFVLLLICLNLIISVVAKCQQMKGFQPMEVLSTNGRITFQQLEGAKFFLTILTRIDTLILVLDAHDYSAKVRIYFQLSVCRNTLICENQLYFHKICNKNKLIAGKNF